MAELECSHDGLTALPPLPSDLTQLYCDCNEISALPNSLPSTLVTLFCSDNILTALPTTLPLTLTELYCCGNKLQVLPDLPPDLQVLACDDNNLTTLPALPSTLTDLYCEGNPITWCSRLGDLIRLRQPNKLIRKVAATKAQRGWKRYRERKQRDQAARKIQKACDNWLFKPKCRDGTIGIVPRLILGKLK